MSRNKVGWALSTTDQDTCRGGEKYFLLNPYVPFMKMSALFLISQIPEVKRSPVRPAAALALRPWEAADGRAETSRPGIAPAFPGHRASALCGSQAASPPFHTRLKYLQKPSVKRALHAGGKPWEGIAENTGRLLTQRRVHDGATPPPQTPSLRCNRYTVFQIISKMKNCFSCKQWLLYCSVSFFPLRFILSSFTLVGGPVLSPMSRSRACWNPWTIPTDIRGWILRCTKAELTFIYIVSYFPDNNICARSLHTREDWLDD